MAAAILRKEVIRHLAQGHGLSVPAITTPPIKALHHDRGRILDSRDTTPLQRPRRVYWVVRQRRFLCFVR